MTANSPGSLVSLAVENEYRETTAAQCGTALVDLARHPQAAFGGSRAHECGCVAGVEVGWCSSVMLAACARFAPGHRWSSPFVLARLAPQSLRPCFDGRGWHGACNARRAHSGGRAPPQTA